MKKLFLSAVGLLLSTALAVGQVNTVPQVGVITNINTQKATYAAVALALPPAASATDIACIAGAAGKLVQVSKIRVSGTAGTLVSAPFTLVRRTAVNTGGTAATTTANWANTISKLDTNSPTASAVLISYSANPTITDASPTYLRSQYTTLPVTSAGTSIAPILWDFANNFLDQPLTLRTAAEQACINLNGVSVSSGLLHLAIEWTEQ
jgi:hypothetical protein